MADDIGTPGYRSGFVAVAGRPNVGKSTLVNRIVGQELAIVTSKPQTTRNRITAIHTLENAQIVLMDAPGIHEAQTPLNKALVSTAMKTLQDADVILFLVNPTETIHDDERRIMDFIRSAGTPAVLAVNKIDTVGRPALLPVIDAYSRACDFAEIIPISAATGEGVDELLAELIKRLPEGPPLFPEDDVSDLPLRFFAAEIVREQVMRLTGEEIPYKTTVVVEAFKESDVYVLIRADIHVERAGQKRILVGTKGSMIKKIGTAARQKLEFFLGRRVRLELFVKVTPGWTKDPRKLVEFGYDPSGRR